MNQRIMHDIPPGWSIITGHPLNLTPESILGWMSHLRSQVPPLCAPSATNWLGQQEFLRRNDLGEWAEMAG
jgi:hypothetical protein